MATVYVVQEVRNRNFFPARKFGDLVALASADSQVVLSATPMIQRLRSGLANFNSEDYLLLSGDPIIMSLAVHIALQVNDGTATLLKWDKASSDYYPVIIDLNDEERDYGD